MQHLYSSSFDNDPAIHGITLRSPVPRSAQATARADAAPTKKNPVESLFPEGDLTFSALIWFVRLTRE
jgi:hypothetical protein